MLVMNETNREQNAKHEAARIHSDLNYGKLRLHAHWDPLCGDPRVEKSSLRWRRTQRNRGARD
ncbi:MAG: hypothetical protein DME43_11245 [Verrucomicrobia bacterium]|jgi:hypothetical protein|nr:MAG: hypothetical protein DME43_11245 [Verrucomicrobiota bacterium]